MFKRKIYNKLSEWKENPSKKPIILKGCRQCGKTFAVTEFARQNYKQVLYVNFLENTEAKAVFEGSLVARSIIMGLSALYGDIVKFCRTKLALYSMKSKIVRRRGRP